MQDLAKPRKISQYLSSQKTRPISNKYQWSSDQVQWTSMTNFHESNTRAAGMNQEPCGSETSQDAPVPVTKDWFGPVTRQNKQSTHQTMKKGRNRCPTQKQGDGTDDAPRKVEWTCLGLHGLAMERSCSLWWRGCSGVTVFPQTQRVGLVWLSLFGCDPATSISSPRTSHGKSARAHKQTTAQATIQEALQADVSRNVRHVLEDSSGDGYRRP